MSGSGLEVVRDDGVLRCTFTRPEARNALTDAMTTGLAEALEAAVVDHDVRAVLIAGTGGSFSAGADIGGEDAHERFDVRALDAANRLVRAVTGLQKPVVAAVDGVAAGVGCSLALACDLAVVSERSSFLLAFARIGLMPDGGATASVAASIGRARAMRMALLAEPLSAREAYDAGLVSHLVPVDDHPETVEAVVGQLAAGPPLAYAAAKRAVNATTLHQWDEALERERTGQTILLRTADVAEGMRAFSERRVPRFRGE
jgi:enoyl-CoA hydratase